mmetsp:Transcript_59943/g.141839  ORF Transcript_59943/g.141839 Transcript_59943/m.141839 type:complete len:111 (+) Transcript_59943:203-535(+)
MIGDGLALQYASAELRRDREVVLVAVAQAGIALQYASAELQGELHRMNMHCSTCTRQQTCGEIRRWCWRLQALALPRSTSSPRQMHGRAGRTMLVAVVRFSTVAGVKSSC